MIWLYLLAVAILGAVVVLLIGRAEGAPPPDADAGGDDVTRLLTERAKSPLTAGDLREVELTTALRGYRMDEVDQLLEHERSEAGLLPVGVNLFVASEVGRTPLRVIIPYVWSFFGVIVATLILLALVPWFSLTLIS